MAARASVSCVPLRCDHNLDAFLPLKSAKQRLHWARHHTVHVAAVFCPVAVSDHNALTKDLDDLEHKAVFGAATITPSVPAVHAVDELVVVAAQHRLHTKERLQIREKASNASRSLSRFFKTMITKRYLG